MLQHRHAAVPKNAYHLGSSVEIRIFHICLKSPQQFATAAVGLRDPQNALDQKATWMLHLLHLQWRYLHGERRENYKKRMAMATMFISKQLSWFRNSKAFNEKRSEWIPGKNMDEPWTILTRLSQAQSAHGFGSSQGCLPVCMILIQLDWFILVSYHPDIISAILFQTAKDVEFLCSSMFNHWMHHHLPAYYFQLPWLFQDVSGMVWLGHVGSTAPSQRAKVPNDSSEPNSSA